MRSTSVQNHHEQKNYNSHSCYALHRCSAVTASTFERRGRKGPQIRSGANAFKSIGSRDYGCGDNRDVHGNIGGPGNGQGNESVVITPTLEERVVDILFEDGDSVRKGQILVKLDDSETRYQLEEAKAALGEQQKQ